MARRIEMPSNAPLPQQYVWSNIFQDACIQGGGLNILDIGPGKTVFPGMMACWGNQVTAVDRLEMVLQYQARIIHGNKIYYNLYLANSEQLPFLDQQFDIVTACWSVGNIERGEDSDLQSFHEAFRVSKHKVFVTVNFSVEGGIRQSQYSGKEKIYNWDALEQRILQHGRNHGLIIDRVTFFSARGELVTHHIVAKSRKALKRNVGSADHVLVTLRRPEE